MGDFRALLLLTAALVIYMVVAEDGQAPVIKTSTGFISGVRTSIGGKDVDIYLGIPYAQPPIGLLRFAKPVPATPWNGTYAAVEKPKPCPQNTHYHTDEVSFYYTNHSEDCLHLNVRKPASVCKEDSCGSMRLPVVVFVHGTDFQWGDSGLYLHDGGNFAALTDTIFVSFNYRLNVFGFLSVGNRDLPGNWGLWDQNLALTWVQRNIGYFGGDPKEVTVIGHGAGAISAGFHAISPQSVGLFKRLVLLSGSPMNVVTRFSSHSFDSVIELGVNLTCDGAKERDIGAVLKCLRGANEAQLLEQVKGPYVTNSIYGPVYGDGYLPDDPYIIGNWKENIRSKEIMIGTTSNEGALFLYSVMKAVPRFNDLLVLDYRSAVQKAIRAAFRLRDEVVTEIMKAYFSGWSLDHNTNDVVTVLSNILGDGLFVCPATFFADEASEQKIPVFRYVFDYRPSFSVLPAWFRASHGDDLAFYLGSLVFLGDEGKFIPGIREDDYDRFKQLKFTAEEEKFMRAMVTSMSQFVKTGRPMIPGSKEPWPRYSSFDPAYINIVPGNITRGLGPKQDTCAMWKRILMKEESGHDVPRKRRGQLKSSRRNVPATGRRTPYAREGQVPTAGSNLIVPSCFVLKSVMLLLLAEVTSWS
ncbi:cholinesterase 1 [Rhipicephalus sanguineus]|uniref:cholinesterase 1 n=1 Tax=Rhipicephalus sanguineus TaxID=34632 RepID=UPI0020C27295|nr:cholinesterase 1 [Rhipicephalus sanguineus]